MQPITDTDIARLRAEAEHHGDTEQAALCVLALGGRDELADAEPGTPWRVLYEAGTTQAEARAECERVIREARDRASEES